MLRCGYALVVNHRAALSPPSLPSRLGLRIPDLIPRAPTAEVINRVLIVNDVVT
jgi:hypothetical protein